ncbi:hypothetical protein ACFPYI_18525 [Halomarina salina]|uniref:Uncharacterized protein n=1 Tax=Halomarina salina TaxID=1872699 RepID=A0ABD5RT54_9EURY|nr:hypothetical protein [Halomarina salina]
MAAQDWLLVGILLAVSGIPFATGNATSHDYSSLFSYAALGIELSGYGIARLNGVLGES